MIYSSSLAIAILLLNRLDSNQGGIEQLLFGDVLGISPLDLTISAILSSLCFGYVLLTLRLQMLLILDESMAVDQRGQRITRHRLIFCLLLALVVGISIKAMGVLLVSAFIVIPACATRALCDRFTQYVILAAILGGLIALLGIIFSAGFDSPSGPSRGYSARNFNYHFVNSGVLKN